MAINAKCPYCLRTYRFEDERAGQPVRCETPECKKLFKVPRLPANGTAASTSNGTTASANGHAHAPVSQPASVSASVSTSSQTPGPMAPVPQVSSPSPPPMPKLPPPPPPAQPPKPPRPKEPVAERSKRTIDAEAVAAEALSDGSQDVGQITEVSMICAMCEFKWAEPLDKQGKFTTCPDCRHRQKVPDIKKENWRDNHKPSLAKIDDVPDNVTSAAATTWASRGALEKAGAIQEDLEPRPRWHYFASVATVIGLFAGIYLGIAAWRHEGHIEKERTFMDEAIAGLPTPESELPLTELPLYRAMLHLAAGEYAVSLATRENKPDALLEARKQFQQTRQELTQAPKSHVRDALFGELAAAQVGLGGTPQQVLDGLRFRWDPEPPSGTRAKIGTKVFNVQEELRQTLQAMADSSKPVERETRFATVRRLSRLLAQQKPPQTRILEQVVHLAFQGDESNAHDAKAQVFAELYRTGETSAALDAIEPLRTMSPPPRTGRVLAMTTEPPIKGWSTIPAPSTSGNITTETRVAYTCLNLLQNKPDEALAMATRIGSPQDRLQALSWVAEWGTDPVPAIQAGAKASAETPKPEVGKPPQSQHLTYGLPVSRLAVAAAKAGLHDQVDLLLDAIHDEPLKVWAKAEALRWKLAADTKKVEETVAEVPDDAKKFRAGHAWGRLAVARHNAAITGDRVAAKDYDRWHKVFTPFGLAGLALGLQDYAQR